MTIGLSRFKCLDLNGIGVITRNDLQYFFDEQLHRMNCLNRVVLLFENVLCQIYDIIHPEVGVHFLF